MDVRDADVAALLAEMLEEIRALRREVVRQTELVEMLLRKVDAIEQTQSG